VTHRYTHAMDTPMTTVRISRKALAALQARRVADARRTGQCVSLSATIAVLLGIPAEPSRRARRFEPRRKPATGGEGSAQ
jgi:hypothetical protein